MEKGRPPTILGGITKEAHQLAGHNTRYPGKNEPSNTGTYHSRPRSHQDSSPNYQHEIRYCRLQRRVQGVCQRLGTVSQQKQKARTSTRSTVNASTGSQEEVQGVAEGGQEESRKVIEEGTQGVGGGSICGHEEGLEAVQVDQEVITILPLHTSIAEAGHHLCREHKGEGGIIVQEVRHHGECLTDGYCHPAERQGLHGLAEPRASIPSVLDPGLKIWRR